MVFLVGVTPIAAQSFFVRGVVHLDRPSGAPAVMATVLIPGTLFGGITNEEGRFELGPLPSGEYSLRVLVAGYKDAVFAINVLDSDLELDLVSRRADVDLDRPDLNSDLSQTILDSQTFLEPGTLADLIRSDPSFELSRIGWAGGRFHGGVPKGPFARQEFVLDDQAPSFEQAFPVSRRIVGTPRLPRRYSIADEAVSGQYVPGQSTIRSLEVVSTRPGAVYPRIVIDGGAHSNGRLAQGALAIDGQQGRLRYAASVSAASAGDYDSGSGTKMEASLRRVAAGATVALRLTPFSDVLAQYSGSVDGQTLLPGTPLRQDRADDRNGGITFRLSRPESRVSQLSAGFTFGNAYEGTSRVETDGTIQPFAMFVSEYFTVAASGVHRIRDRSSGSFSVSYREAKQTPEVDDEFTPLVLTRWKSNDLRFAYIANGTVGASTVSAAIDWQRRRISNQQDPVDFDLVSGQLEFTRRLKSATHATLLVASENDSPNPALLFGIQFPMQVGQHLAFLNGDRTLASERFNTIALRVFSERPTTAVSLRGSLVNLHRYTSIVPDSNQFMLTESSGTAFSVNGSVSLARPPFVSTSLVGIFVYGVDQNTRKRIVGTRSPRVQWNARIQTPGGSIFVQPALNAVVGLPSADPQWERDSRTALWIDLTAGMARGRAEWFLGVRNLNDSSWRFHTSLLAFSTASPMFERGRSFFIRYRRRL